MSLLAGLINKTKQKATKEFGKNKWRRRADVEQERVEQQKRKAKEERELREMKRALELDADEEGPNKRVKLADGVTSPTKMAKDIAMTLSDDEVFKRLRRLKQPIRFFGETPEDRVKRLRQLELMEAERSAGASEGRTNEFQDIIGKEVDAEIEAALAKSMGTDVGELEKDRIKQKAKEKKYDRPRGKHEFKQLEDYILFFWKRIIREWEKQLTVRSESQKISNEGKAETMRQKQARRDIKPFFKLLKNRQAPHDVVKLVTATIDALINRNYELAQEKYLEMSIGNAPWPMGVTQVGIHERAGRSKIFSSQIAHILNDETQRKYIQAMKRLMTVAQKMYPAYSVEQLEQMKMDKAAEKTRQNIDLVKLP